MSIGVVVLPNIDSGRRQDPPKISTSATALILGGLIPLFVKRPPPNVRLATAAGLSLAGWWKAYYDLRVPPDMTRIEW
jgi:hypothetical protein